MFRLHAGHAKLVGSAICSNDEGVYKDGRSAVISDKSRTVLTDGA